MEMLASFGVFGAIIGIFWVIASFFIPFFIWGMHSKSHKVAKDVAEIKNAVLRAVDIADDSAQDEGSVRDM